MISQMILQSRQTPACSNVMLCLTTACIVSTLQCKCHMSTSFALLTLAILGCNQKWNRNSLSQAKYFYRASWLQYVCTRGSPVDHVYSDNTSQLTSHKHLTNISFFKYIVDDNYACISQWKLKKVFWLMILMLTSV